MIQLTEAAQKKAKELLSSKEEGSVLRVSVRGGGCAGFVYDVQICKPEKTDRIFSINGITVACDFQSLPLIQGTTIDFKEGLVGAGFVFQNPNATGSCGCGTSFTI